MTVALERFANAAQTTLSAAMTNVQTTASVASSTGFPTQVTSPIQYRVLVDSEIMVVTGGFGTATWTVTRGAEGTTAAAHSSGASVTHLVTQGALERWTPNYVPWMPWQQNMLLGTFDPLHATVGVSTSTGFILLARMWVPETIAASNLQVVVTTAGATLTAGQNLAGIYSQSGALLAQTGDQSGSWNSTGLKTMALTGAPVTITGGPDVFVWGALLANGTTAPQIAWSPSSLVSATVNTLSSSAIPGTIMRSGFVSGGTRTSLVSLNGLTVANSGAFGAGIFWMGVT